MLSAEVVVSVERFLFYRCNGHGHVLLNGRHTKIRQNRDKLSLLKGATSGIIMSFKNVRD